MNPKTKCARPGCGKPRSWHLGLGGMGICRPEFNDGSSDLSKSDESMGGFIEPLAEHVVKQGFDALVETQVDGNWVRAVENVERAYGEAILHWNSIGLFEPLG